MEFFTNATIQLLKILSDIFGSYGIGIILLTIIVRLFVWPLSVSQQRSMRLMQKLQPKLKMIQERYKSDPQVMQRKMMEFYKENNFNPMGGCLPVLIQMPIFILLYTALISPQFIDIAGNAKFLFINRLDATIMGSSARSYDGNFMLRGSSNNFVLGKKGTVYFSDGSMEEVKPKNSKDNLKFDVLAPAENQNSNIRFRLTLNAFPVETTEDKTIQSAEVEITNIGTREIENVKFERKGDVLVAEVPAEKSVSNMNYDVLLLVLLFGFTMFISTKVMTMTKSSQLDPQQEAMQKMMGKTMPIVLTATFFFIPIPAGVLLYLVVSNLLQIVQTVIINKNLEKSENNVVDVKPE